MKLLSSAVLASVLAVTGMGMHTAAVAGPKDAIHAKALQTAKLGVLDAVEIAQKQHGLRVISVELDLKKGQPQLEVEGVNAQNQKVELALNAVNGQIIQSEVDGAADQKHLDRLATAKVSLQAAVAAAQKAEAGGQVVEVELDDHKGVLNYEVKVFTGGHTHKLRVNALDGSVAESGHKHKH